MTSKARAPARAGHFREFNGHMQKNYEVCRGGVADTPVSERQARPQNSEARKGEAAQAQNAARWDIRGGPSAAATACEARSRSVSRASSASCAARSVAGSFDAPIAPRSTRADGARACGGCTPLRLPRAAAPAAVCSTVPAHDDTKVEPTSVSSRRTIRRSIRRARGRHACGERTCGGDRLARHGGHTSTAPASGSTRGAGSLLPLVLLLRESRHRRRKYLRAAGR